MYLIKTFPSVDLGANKFRGVLLSNMQRVEKAMLDDFNKTVETWNHAVVFNHVLHYSGGNAIIEIHTDDPAWGYLDDGTSIRYATMTMDFQAKTKTHWIGSTTGQGGLKFVSRAVPHRGITAREWSTDIADKYDDILQLAIDEAIRRAIP